MTRNHIQVKKSNTAKESGLKDHVKCEFQIMKYGNSQYTFLKFWLVKSTQTELKKKIKMIEKDLAITLSNTVDKK